MKLLPAHRLVLAALAEHRSGITFEELAFSLLPVAFCVQRNADPGHARGYFRDVLAELVRDGLVTQWPAMPVLGRAAGLAIEATKEATPYTLSEQGWREFHGHRLVLTEERAEHPERVVALSVLATLAGAGVVLWALWSFVL